MTPPAPQRVPGGRLPSSRSESKVNISVDSGGLEIAPGVQVPPERVRFTFSRSSGPGGQNVNKVNTRAELRVRLADLIRPDGPLPKLVAARLRRLAGRRLTKEDELVLVCDTHRTQRQNRKECLARLRGLLIQAQHRPRVRRKTKPSRGAIERRLKQKRVRGVIKGNRRRVDGGD